MTFTLSAAAAQELAAYLDLIEADDPAAAQRTERPGLDALDQLAERPGLGRRARIRGWPHAIRSFVPVPLPLRVFYQETADGILVVRVFHTSRRPVDR